MRFVVDTSSIVAVIVGESEKAKLVELTQDATIVVPPSIEWEVGNAFSAMLKRARITLDEAIEAIKIYQEISMEVIPVDLIEAVRIAGKYNIYAYDAYILQCAIENGLPLISLDQRLIEIAKREAIQVIEVTT